MSFYPYNARLGQEIQGVPGTKTDRGFIAHQFWADPAAGAADSIVDGATPGTATALVLDAGDLDGQPDYARALVIVGNNASVAGTVEVVGTNVADESITEDIVLSGTAPVNGSAAFKTVSRVTIPAQSNGAYTVDVGTTDKLGLITTLAHNTVLSAYLDGAREGTLPTVAVNAADVEFNTVDLNSALDGNSVDVYYIV